MIPTNAPRVVHTGATGATASFGISEKNTAHIMGILRDNLYSDRVLAIMREYAANAWDAHRDAGLDELPILVNLPTFNDPNLRIRDYGKGLSHEDVMTVYNQYGDSTKRESNRGVGQLGIGSKSAFCYADTFTITSHHDGVKRIYIAVIDESQLGKVDFVHEEPTTETGVEIQIAAHAKDISEFHDKAAKLFRHFEPRPVINTVLPDPTPARAKLTHGSIRAYNDGEGWLALMGCIPYRVDMSEIDQDQVGVHLQRICGELFFDIGEVEMAASRETLRYTQRTKDALVDKLTLLTDEFIEHTMNTIESGAYTQWERRLRAQVLRELELPIPEQWEDLAGQTVKLVYNPDDFTVISHAAVTTRMSVGANTKLYIDDTGKGLVGYGLQYSDLVVRPADKCPSMDVMCVALAACLDDAGVTGVPIIALSTRHWSAPYVKPKKASNPKHKVSTFKLVPRPGYGNPYSNHWTVEKREPHKDDVYVLVRKFKVPDNRYFFSQYEDDAKILRHFGGGFVMPEIYGYKDTIAKPADRTKILGTPYAEWRKTITDRVVTPAIIDLFAASHWLNMSSDSFMAVPGSRAVVQLETALGAPHPIVKLFASQAQAQAALLDLQGDKRSALITLMNRTQYKFKESTAYVHLQDIYADYPLLKIAGIGTLWGSNATHWLDYVRVVDAYKALIDSTPAPLVHLDHITAAIAEGF